MTDSFTNSNDHLIVFTPSTQSVSEQSFKSFLKNWLVDMNFWDEEYELPWRRDTTPMPESTFKPMALIESDIGINAIVDRDYVNLLTSWANDFGYSVIWKDF